MFLRRSRLRLGVLSFAIVLMTIFASPEQGFTQPIPPRQVTDDTPTAQIDAAVRAGRLTADDGLIFRVLLLRAQRALPAEFRPTRPMRSGTWLVEEITERLPAAHPEVRAYVSYLLAPLRDRRTMPIPTLTSARLSRRDVALTGLSIAAPLSVQAAQEPIQNHQTDHFSIWYYTTSELAPKGYTAAQQGHLVVRSMPSRASACHG